MKKSESTSAETPKSGELGSEPTNSAPESESRPKSMRSAKQSSGSKRRYRTPRNVAEFAAVANEVAIKVLNEEIDLETARNFASVARVVSQLTSARVAHARFNKTAPDLSLEAETMEDVE